MKKLVISAFLVMFSFLFLCVSASAAGTVYFSDGAKPQFYMDISSTTSVDNVGWNGLCDLASYYAGHGIPCAIQIVTFAGGSYFALQVTGTVQYRLGDVSSTYQTVPGRYFGSVNGPWVARVNADTLLSSIDSNITSFGITISSKLTSVGDSLSTLISSVSSLGTKLDSLTSAVSTGNGRLNSIYNFLAGDLFLYLSSIDSAARGAATSLVQSNDKLNTLINTLTTENGKNSLFYPITKRLDSILSSMGSPQVSLNYPVWRLNNDSISELTVSDIGYDALSSLCADVAADYLNFQVSDGSRFYSLDLIDSLDLVHTTVAGHTGYFIQVCGTYRLVDPVTTVCTYIDGVYYLSERNGTLFYASSDSRSTFSFDDSGIVNALSNISNKLDNLPVADNSNIVGAITKLNDSLTYLFSSPYSGTYGFQSLLSFDDPYEVHEVHGVDPNLFYSFPEDEFIWYSTSPVLTVANLYDYPPCGEQPLGTSYDLRLRTASVRTASGFDVVPCYRYWEYFPDSDLENGTVLLRDIFGVDLLGGYFEISDVPCTFSGGRLTCNLIPKFGSFGEWLGWYVDDVFFTLDSPPPVSLLSSPPVGEKYYVYYAGSAGCGGVDVVFNSRFTSFLNSQISLVLSAIGSAGGSDLTGVTTRLDTIIEELRSSGGEFSCEHTYTQEMTQAPTCILPGLQVSTCSKCGSSYSEIVSALGHDWQCTDHVEDETDPDTGEVTATGYDVYECSRCGDTYNDYSGSGAPDDYGDTSISKIIVRLFSKLGTFAGKIISWIIGLFDKVLGGLDDLITRFSELTAQITGFGGDYPTWLSGFWGILPQELQLALGFSFVCLFVGLIGRKLFFA